MVAPAILEHVRYQRLYKDAADFTTRYGSIEERQIIGLRALFAAGIGLDQIREFMEKRRDRNRAAGRTQAQAANFWHGLLRRISVYEQTAGNLLGQTEVRATDCYQLIEAFVVCLVAENRYQSMDRDARRQA